ncbi:MAG: amidohydrolase [Alphaproteobacteria bacterium]|nr:amidohydrolase [Alphaproteobacteria bacterium]
MILLKNVYLNGQTTDILIKQNRFFQIKNNISAENAEILDCTNKAILPSFCNMHTHSAMMFLRGIGEDLELMDWLEKEIWPREDKLNDEYVYHISKFSVLEMIKTGTTMFLDMYFHIGETIKAVDEMGIRAVITYVGMDMFDKNETKRRIKNAEDFLSIPSPCHRVMKGLSPHAVYTASEELIKVFKKMTLENDTFLHTHVCETQKEVDDCIQKYGVPPVQLLSDWGILDQKTILAHAVHLKDDEINILKQSQSVVVHNPASNLKLNSGQMPLQRYLDAGIKVTLGTDSASSNNSLSMIDEMKIAALSGKNQANSSTSAKVQDIFDMATINGFEALGVQAGKIKEGYLADFILVDLNNYSLLPNVNLISNMVYSANPSCITDVFCDGKCVMKNAYVKGEEEIISNFKKTCHELLKE